MIPLRDTIPARRFPVVNTVLIGLNVLVFLFEAAMGQSRLEQLIAVCGLVPVRFWQGGGLDRWWPLLASIFLHAGWWHLIANMLSLYIFGDNVEDRLGHLRYLLFYLFSGLAASGAHLLAYRGSTLPTIGASGAIAGVLGAYMLLFPRARIITLLPIFYFIRIVQVPALLYLGFWFVSQLFNGLFALAAADVFQAGGVAWWAHIGGFVFGLAIIKLICPRPCRTYPDEYRPW
jgi:membrane associated rhomboid family serine protease